MPAAAKIVDFAESWSLDEALYKLGHIVRMNIIPYLFSLITVNFVGLAFEIATDQVAEKTVQLDSRVIRSRQTTGAQATTRHLKITSIFLHHHVCGHL